MGEKSYHLLIALLIIFFSSCFFAEKKGSLVCSILSFCLPSLFGLVLVWFKVLYAIMAHSLRNYKAT